MRADLKEKACGCVTFAVGPPVFCDKHLKKIQSSEERGLRKAVREQSDALAHDLTPFEEYESTPGKWTAYCRFCGNMFIVYDEIPSHGGDQIAGWALTTQCAGRSKASTSA